jgi:hypothetical protein
MSEAYSEQYWGLDADWMSQRWKLAVLGWHSLVETAGF